MRISRYGLTDTPVSRNSEDIFGVRKYILGLSQFITKCPTPMTIAIQGDWGSGKTSFMQLIDGEIHKDVLSVWFNTWQFSQFNLGDQLPLIFMEKLSEAISTSNKSIQYRELIGKLWQIASSVGSAAISNACGVDLAEAAKDLESKNITTVIETLKTQLESDIQSTLKKENKERLVIFVDDLDRLEPTRAVELLEVLKIFLDCKDCVFVLALDYGVVSRGVEKKYGDTLDSGKGKSFFDKIIQLPFKMPVAQYDIHRYVLSALEQLDLSIDDCEPYVELIHDSVGYNPRAIKRLFNAFSLLQLIYQNEKITQDNRLLILFAVLCMQQSYEELYNFIVLHSDDLTDDFFCKLQHLDEFISHSDESESSPGADSMQDLVLRLEDIDDPRYAARLCRFLQCFCQIIRTPDSAQETFSIPLLTEVLLLSATTATDIPTSGKRISGNGKTGRGVRHSKELDTDFAWHASTENVGSDPGWGSAVIEQISIDGKQFACSTGADYQRQVITHLCEEYPEQMQRIMEDFSLSGAIVSLFHGAKRDENKERVFAAASKITVNGSEVPFETKSGINAKIDTLNQVLKLLDLPDDYVKILCKLAHYTQSE